MGLLTILKKLRQKEKEMRILMLGLDNAGKTTILKRINGEDVNTVSPTLGFNIKTLEHNGYKLNIWDIGGQKSIRSYWRNYFESTDALIWVVDSADRMRLKDCAAELKSLLKEERLAGATLLVFANKQDLPAALSAHEIRIILDLDSIHTHHWSIQPVSAVHQITSSSTSLSPSKSATSTNPHLNGHQNQEHSKENQIDVETENQTVTLGKIDKESNSGLETLKVSKDLDQFARNILKGIDWVVADVGSRIYMLD